MIIDGWLCIRFGLKKKDKKKSGNGLLLIYGIYLLILCEF